MENIGLLGASFNPIHLGHLIMADQAKDRYDLDKVLFIPTYKPYHKEVDMLDYPTRLTMVELAIGDRKDFIPSRVEENIEKNSYSYDTVKKIKKIYKNANLYFIMGEDSLLYIDKWYKYKEFLDMVQVIVFRRDVSGSEKFDQQVKKLEEMGYKIHIVDDMKFEISSSFIREAIARDKSINYLLPIQVADYIRDKKLYR